MPTAVSTSLQPRKQPVQARSAASVDALLEATLQVLVAIGKEQLTTTRVAERAGVSVGTLYQYFPNKRSLLQATLRRHFEEVTSAVLQACEEHRGKPLVEMGTALAGAFLSAKLQGGANSVALYAVSSDVDGIAIAKQMSRTLQSAIRGLLKSAPDRPAGDLRLVVTTLQGAMSGVSRTLLESPDPTEAFAGQHAELLVMVRGYLGQLASAPGRPL